MRRASDRMARAVVHGFSCREKLMVAPSTERLLSGREAASARMKWAGWLTVATSSMAGERSTPVASMPVRAAMPANTPVPQHRSVIDEQPFFVSREIISR